MGTGTKTDNHNPTAKLDLRRYFLDRYHHGAAPRVIDCCRGSGHLWAQLRREYKLGGYWGMDVKPKPGRLKIASERVLAQPGWEADVIDVDTYGSPWKHWRAMLPHVPRHPLTVFLTIGQTNIGGGNMERGALATMGITFRDMPNALGVKVAGVALRYSLAAAYDHGLIIREAVEAENDGGSARYIGVRLEPK